MDISLSSFCYVRYGFHVLLLVCLNLSFVEEEILKIFKNCNINAI